MADADKGRAYLEQMAKPRVNRISSLRGAIERLWDRGLPPGDKTGWSSVDKHYTVAEGMVTVVTGWPSSGKSEWLDAMLVNLAKQGWRIAAFSPENSPLELHSSKLMEKTVGKPFGRGPTERINREDLAEHIDALDESFMLLSASDGGSLSAKEIMDAALPWLMELEDRKRGLVIDPWNELEHWRPANLTETEYISKQLQLVRNWARANNVHVWIVAHPKNTPRENGKLPIPRPDMIAGSQHWWNKADFAITVWRDMENQDVQNVDIHVQKVRFKHIGRPGVVTLKWDRVTGRYFEPPPVNLYDVNKR